ncbi:hypothetical protein [Coleofasciculus sp.]|uniref:hypothetical protein n=1 Tax=Coleofasciculus sp. TaxID=3100458 RepID=UPI0039F78887
MPNTRIRIDSDIEAYIKSQSKRVMDIPADKLTAADLTTLTNRLLYEHKLTSSLMKQEFIPRLFGWLKGIVPGLGGGKVVQIAPQQTQPELPSDDLDFAADFASQFDEDVA